MVLVFISIRDYINGRKWITLDTLSSQYFVDNTQDGFYQHNGFHQYDTMHDISTCQSIIKIIKNKKTGLLKLKYDGSFISKTLEQEALDRLKKLS